MYAKRLHYDLIMLIDAYVKCFLAQFIWVCNSLSLYLSGCVCVLPRTYCSFTYVLLSNTQTNTSIVTCVTVFTFTEMDTMKSASKQQFEIGPEITKPNEIQSKQWTSRCLEKSRRYNVRAHGKHTHKKNMNFTITKWWWKNRRKSKLCRRCAFWAFSEIQHFA